MKSLRLLWPLVALIAGILLQNSCDLSALWGLSAMGVGSCSLVALRMLGKGRKLRGRRQERLTLLAVLLTIGGTGISTASFRMREDRFDHPRFDRFCASLPEKSRLTLHLEKMRSGHYGDYWDCRFTGTITDSAGGPLSTYQIIESGEGQVKAGKADPSRFSGQPLRLRFSATPYRTDDLISVPASKVCENKFIGKRAVRPEGYDPTLSGCGRRVQQRFCTFIERSVRDDGTRRFLCALLAGESGFMDREERSMLTDAGLAHILAVSGMHVGIIGSIVYLLLYPFQLFRGWRGRKLVLLPIVWFYVLATGFGPSVVRAAIMLSLALLGYGIERKRGAGNALLAAAFLILLFDPSALFHVGFQLSFVCVAGILLFCERLNPVPRHDYPKLYKLTALFLVPVVATLSTWVITAYYFGRIPLAFLPLNLIVVPLLPAYFVVALLHLSLSAAGIPNQWSENILTGGYRFLLKGAEMVSAGGETVCEYHPGLTEVLVWLGFIALAGWVLNSRTPMLRRLAERASSFLRQR